MDLEPNVWNVEQIRLSSFRAPGVNFSAQEAWGQVAGVPIEEITTKPAVGSEQVQGSFADGRLLLNVEVGRIDWIYTPAPPQPEVPPAFFSVGTFAGVAPTFSTLTAKWLEVAPPTTRVALAAALLEPAEDRIAAYKRLLSFATNLKLDPDNASDLLYQINRFKQSTVVDGLKVNRLTKWTCQKLVVFSSLNNIPTQMFTAVNERHVVRLELDVNSDGERVEPFDRKVLSPLLQEIEGHVRAISQEGDRA